MRVIPSDLYKVFLSHFPPTYTKWSVLQRMGRFITLPFPPPYVPWYSSNETDNG